jgi:hypothetical protein
MSFFFFKDEVCVSQADLESLGSCGPIASVSQVAKTLDVYHHTWLSCHFYYCSK